MRTTVHSLVGHAVLCVALLGTVSCSRSSPLAPARTPATLGGPTTMESGDSVEFPLVAGSFAVVNRSGDEIAGTYAGTSRFSAAGQRASVTLQALSGSGAFAGATGTIVMIGSGAFADEGGFSLDGAGTVTLGNGKPATIVLSLRGDSAASCSPRELIAIGQTAAGTMSRAGRVIAILSHEVENTGCIS